MKPLTHFHIIALYIIPGVTLCPLTWTKRNMSGSSQNRLEADFNLFCLLQFLL